MSRTRYHAIGRYVPPRLRRRGGKLSAVDLRRTQDAAAKRQTIEPQAIFDMRFPASDLVGWYKMIAHNQVRLFALEVLLGDGTVGSCAQSDLTLTGNPEYCYVEMQRGTSSPEWKHDSSVPRSNSTHIRVKRFKFVPLDGVYFRREWYGLGDIVFDLPLRT